MDDDDDTNDFVDASRDASYSALDDEIDDDD